MSCILCDNDCNSHIPTKNIQKVPELPTYINIKCIKCLKDACFEPVETVSIQRYFIRCKTCQKICCSFCHSQHEPIRTCSSCPKVNISPLQMMTYQGNLNEMVKLIKNGSAVDKDIARIAAEFGQVDCLRYLITNGHPWDREKCFDVASKNLHVNCMMAIHTSK